MTDLITRAQIADLAEVSVNAVRKMEQRRASNGFPKRASSPNAQVMYRRDEIERWLTDRPQAGRPRKGRVTN